MAADAEERCAEEVVGATLQTFVESTEVMQLLDELPFVVRDLRKKEIAEQRFTGEGAG